MFCLCVLFMSVICCMCLCANLVVYCAMLSDVLVCVLCVTMCAWS